MRLTSRSVAAYATAILSLLPRGRIWPHQLTSSMAMTARGVAPTAQRLDARAVALLADAFPPQAYELLPEWERTLGLPDPCAGENPSLQQRRGQVTARLTATGGQSAGYFVRHAARLGYAITVESFGPARLGALRLGGRMNDERWAHAWAVLSAETTQRQFRLGLSTLGEPFRAWGNEVLECELRALAPAHTVLIFQYS
ncbi:DUF2313 domain-containing protein [Roseomonas nepalensis]|uniref:DUF2313 domain-containing protein n=1 Tax=Muricoccus nepalensis TaxID=1854500 RepID=A0A502FUP6_9PROT|nr:putative phage tail protein [Roseomonas nepalensis]TPG53278.1 DUF2313 domain-containing protein [Roseomonas nepalensis]